MSLRDLGRLSGVSFDSIHGIESGKRTPRPTTVRKLASALGVDPEEFFSDGPDAGLPRHVAGSDEST